MVVTGEGGLSPQRRDQQLGFTRAIGQTLLQQMLRKLRHRHTAVGEWLVG